MYVYKLVDKRHTYKHMYNNKRTINDPTNTITYTIINHFSEFRSKVFVKVAKSH